MYDGLLYSMYCKKEIMNGLLFVVIVMGLEQGHDAQCVLSPAHGPRCLRNISHLRSCITMSRWPRYLMLSSGSYVTSTCSRWPLTSGFRNRESLRRTELSTRSCRQIGSFLLLRALALDSSPLLVSFTNLSHAACWCAKMVCRSLRNVRSVV